MITDDHIILPWSLLSYDTLSTRFIFCSDLEANAHGIPPSTFRTWHNTIVAEKLRIPQDRLKNVLKNGLPRLNDYKHPPAADFWKMFPFRDIP